MSWSSAFKGPVADRADRVENHLAAAPVRDARWSRFAGFGRSTAMFGPLGPMAETIPTEAERHLEAPVVVAKPCGAAEVTIPMLGRLVAAWIVDRFAGRGSIRDGRRSPTRSHGRHDHLAGGFAGASLALARLSVITICSKPFCSNLVGRSPIPLKQITTVLASSIL